MKGRCREGGGVVKGRCRGGGAVKGRCREGGSEGQVQCVHDSCTISQSRQNCMQYSFEKGPVYAHKWKEPTVAQNQNSWCAVVVWYKLTNPHKIHVCSIATFL